MATNFIAGKPVERTFAWGGILPSSVDMTIDPYTDEVYPDGITVFEVADPGASGNLVFRVKGDETTVRRTFTGLIEGASYPDCPIVMIYESGTDSWTGDVVSTTVTKIRYRF